MLDSASWRGAISARRNPSHLSIRRGPCVELRCRQCRGAACLLPPAVLIPLRPRFWCRHAPVHASCVGRLILRWGVIRCLIHLRSQKHQRDDKRTDDTLPIAQALLTCISLLVAHGRMSGNRWHGSSKQVQLTLHRRAVCKPFCCFNGRL